MILPNMILPFRRADDIPAPERGCPSRSSHRLSARLENSHCLLRYGRAAAGTAALRLRNKSSLRSFLLCAVACSFLFIVHAADRKPNFLFIYTDDQRWDAMSV